MNFPPPQLSPSLFWDTDMAQIDWQQHAPGVIERVLTRGTLHEWDEIVRFYGEEFIKETAMKLRYLDPYPLSFWSTIWQIPQEKFRCYISSQSKAPHWIYR